MSAAEIVRSGWIASAIFLGIVSGARAENPSAGPCGTALSKGVVCEAANYYALDRMKEGHLEGILVMQEVRTGALVVFAASNPATFDVTTALLPLSPVKLLVAASWLDQQGGRDTNVPERDKLLTDSIVSGNDKAGFQIASALREAVGTDTVLQDLERYGFPPRENQTAKMDIKFWAELAPRWRERLVPAASYHSLGKETTTKQWEDTLSIGERGFIATALHLSRFLQAVGNGGVMVAPVAKDEDSASGPESTIPAPRIISESAALKLQTLMRGTVERGTAKSAFPILAGSGWSMGGKTGTGPEPGTTAAGARSDGCFTGLIFDPQGKARFSVVSFVKHGGFGGGNAARISAELALFLSGAHAK